MEKAEEVEVKRKRERYHNGTIFQINEREKFAKTNDWNNWIRQDKEINFS